jgi:hypothetical protein
MHSVKEVKKQNQIQSRLVVVEWSIEKKLLVFGGPPSTKSPTKSEVIRVKNGWAVGRK